MKRLLGVDVGTVRVGVALSDPLGMTAQPLEVIQRRKQDPFKRIAALVSEHEVELIVVGDPKRLDGSEGLASEAAARFVDKLQKTVEVQVTLWDERLTTAAAERSLLEGNVRRADRRQRIDKVAAALILQSYLDAHPA